MNERLVKYLHDTLNVDVALEPWVEERALPLFLRDDYRFYRAVVKGSEFLLMVESGAGNTTPANLRKQLDQVRRHWPGAVVYVCDQVSSYVRKRLIEAGIQFIVPGNQLFLPDLAIDLREFFRQKQKRTHRFSPATQVLILYWMFNQGSLAIGETTPTEMAPVLGYTKMTMARAFKEIDLVLEEARAADQGIHAKTGAMKGRELWERLQPYWRNPISHRRYLPKVYLAPNASLRAGLTALADYTMLSAPDQETYAMSQRDWKKLMDQPGVQVVDQPDAQAVQIEVWTYSPQILAANGLKGAVDPLSLYLSLRSSLDERIQIALEELLGGVKW
jgi:hypothetical protein